MPIKSYLVIPEEGKKVDLKLALDSFPQCEVTLSENKDVLLLVTDTTNKETDKELMNQLLQLPELRHLNLVSAFSV